MKFRILVLIIVAVLAGCVSPTQEIALPIPKPGATHYDAPDGRRWILSHEGHTPDGIHSFSFTPEPTSLREWKEKLSFVSTTKDLSIEGLRKSFGEVQRTDPGFTFSIRKSKGALLATFQLPKWNERGVQKVVRRDNTFISIAYEERIGPEADERLRLWTGFLEKLTAETLREMRLD